MTWQEYYDKFYDWADSTQIRKLSSITDFSGADPEEVMDAALAFADEVPATRLLRKALDGGVRFSADQVLELIYDVREDFQAYFAEHAGAVYTEEHLDELSDLLPEDTVRALAQCSGVDYGADDDGDCDMDYDEDELEEDLFWDEEEPPAVPRRKSGLGFFGTLFAILGASGGSGDAHQHSGKCCGDCSKCPPHYGYRYGRWYYGRNHVYGCEFGGNSHPGKT